MAASIGGPTTPGTATTEVQERGVPPPPPGLHPPDFTNWSLPLPEAPATGGLPTPSGGLPGIGRQTVGTAYAGTKRSPGNAASSSAEAAPACYTLSAGGAAAEPACYTLSAGSAAAEPACYSSRAVDAAIEPACYTVPEAMQLPRRPAERGLLARPTSDGADRGRQQARGQGIRGRSASCP